MAFDPNNYDVVNDDVNTVADYENTVNNTKGGKIGQVLKKKSSSNHDFEFGYLEKSDVGLDQVDNTSDINKPISNNTQSALDNKVDKVLEKGLSTEDYTTTEKNKLAGIEDNAQVNQTDAEIKFQYENNENTNVFTDAEKSKLAGLDSSLFLGTYINLTALESAHPSPTAGSYAYVDEGIGQDVKSYIWDNNDNKYVLQLGESTTETPASIKTKYESNPDTNVYTDSEKIKLSNVEANAEVNLIDSIVAGTDIAVDVTDPKNPVISYTGTGGTFDGNLAGNTFTANAPDTYNQSFYFKGMFGENRGSSYGAINHGQGTSKSLIEQYYVTNVRTLLYGNIFANTIIGTRSDSTDYSEKLCVHGRLYLRDIVEPSTPVNGGIVYVQDGALKYKGSNGTVTPLADA